MKIQTKILFFTIVFPRQCTIYIFYHENKCMICIISVEGNYMILFDLYEYKKVFAYFFVFSKLFSHLFRFVCVQALLFGNEPSSSISV